MYSLVVSAVSAAMGFSVLVVPVQAREGRTPAVQVASGHLTTEQVVDRVLTNVEPQILRRYYEARGGSASSESSEDSGKHGRKGKNKGKRKGLPPGLAKRGGILPPGLAKRGVVFFPG